MRRGLPRAAIAGPADPIECPVFSEECPVSSMPRYRYRTATLIGPWRDSVLKAETDAVAIGLAALDGPGGRLAWKVQGEIEVSERPERLPAPDPLDP